MLLQVPQHLLSSKDYRNCSFNCMVIYILTAWISTFRRHQREGLQFNQGLFNDHVYPQT